MTRVGPIRCAPLRLAHLFSLAVAASAAVAADAAGGGCAASVASSVPQDHAMLQVAKQTSKGEILPANPYIETLDLEHEKVGCFPRAAHDAGAQPANFRDLECADLPHANETGESQDPERCHSGLPFYRLPLQPGQSYLDCFGFCLSKGLDLFGVMSQSWGQECRCGATTANKAAWKGREPRAELLLPEAPLPEGDEKCALLVWRYSGGFEDDAVPWALIKLSGADLAYVDGIALGRRRVDFEASDTARAPADKAEEEHTESGQGKAALLSVRGYCEDYAMGSPEPKWVCSQTTCSQSICSVGTLAQDCCPRTCGRCSGTFVPCTGGVHCAGGQPWPKSSGVAYINYDFVNLNAAQQNAFVKATEAWEQGSCVRFVRSSANPKLSVGIWDSNSCTASRVGYPGAGGEVQINMGFCNTIQDKGLLIHEIGHALGMNHEHFRPDTTKTRNGQGPYLEVYWYNFYGNWANQYKEDPSSYVGSTHLGYVPYDFESVMHYPSGAGGNQGAQTFRTLPNGVYDSEVGQLDHISSGDFTQLNDMYQCGTQSSPTPSPPPSSCQDSSSYTDPEYGAGCSAWRGYACQPSGGWRGASYSSALRCACPSSCNACDSLSSCSSSPTPAPPAPTPAPTPAAPTPIPNPAACQDTGSYRDPEYGSSCSEWQGYSCQPSSGWSGASYRSELRCACPVSCNACTSRRSCSSSPSPPACSDSTMYRDPEYNAACSAWRGYACQPSSNWPSWRNYGAELRSNCPSACNQC